MRTFFFKLIGYKPGIVRRQMQLVGWALGLVLLLIFLVWALQGFPMHFQPFAY